MKSKTISTTYYLSLIFSAIIGFFFVIFSIRARYGVGLSPDSVAYISVARNLITGKGFITYDGTPMVHWPPLYPIVLALAGIILRSDPFFIAHIVNSIIFALIVYVSGILSHRYLTSFPSLAFVTTLTVLFSKSLNEISMMALSEILFTLLLILSLLLSEYYLTKKTLLSVLLFALCVSLSCLTRYIGVTLIMWGAIIIFVFYRGSFKTRVTHMSLFVFISAFPLGLWLIRNYLISGEPSGNRHPSPYTLFQNISFTNDTILHWYIPNRIHESKFLLGIFTVSIILFIGFSLINNFKNIRINTRQVTSISSLVVIYILFLIITSTIALYDQIHNRFLAPIYVPMTLLILMLLLAIVVPHKKIVIQKIMKSVVLLCLVIWLLYPIRSMWADAKEPYQTRMGYSSRIWKHSATIEYLRQHRIESLCEVYTNYPEVTYILADIPSKSSPGRLSNSSVETIKGSWPEEEVACLVWFDVGDREYVYTLDELQTVINFKPIAQFNDGSIYYITKK